MSPRKTAPSGALQQRDPHPGALRWRSRRDGAAAAPGPRRASQPHALTLPFARSSFFFQFFARCLERVGSPPKAVPRAGEGAPEPPPPACAGSCGSVRAVGARSPAEGAARGARRLKLAAVFELSPFFFPSLPSFPPFLPPSLLLSPFFPSPSLSHSPAFKDGTASHCVFMYIIRQLVPSTSFASLQYLYKHITLSVACTFCYGCCHSLRDLTFIF